MEATMNLTIARNSLCDWRHKEGTEHLEAKADENGSNGSQSQTRTMTIARNFRWVMWSTGGFNCK